MSHSLTVDQNQKRVDASEECLGIFKRNKAEFFRRYITTDEVWIHDYTRNLNVCHLSGRRPVKAARSAQRINDGLEKSWHSFFGMEGEPFSLITFKKVKTINGEYYIALLERLKTEVAKNGRTWRARRSCSTKTTRRVTSH